MLHPHRPHHRHQPHHHVHPVHDPHPHHHPTEHADNSRAAAFIRGRSQGEMLGALLAVVVLAWLVLGAAGIAVVLLTGVPVAVGVLRGMGVRP
jgi:hypothetical protein